MLRRIVLLYWVCAIILIPKAVYAYIDPATTTYLIQIATALVVMAGVSLSIFLYRFRTIVAGIKYWLYGTVYRLKNRENQKSEKKSGNDTQRTDSRITPDYILPGSADTPDILLFDEPDREKLSEERGAMAPKEPSRVLMTVPLAIAFCYTFIIIGCLELAAKHAPEIPFRIISALPVVLVCFSVLFVLLVLIIPRFRGKTFDILLIIGLSVLTAGYVQGNFLNSGIGQLTGDTVIWSDLIPQYIASLVCWSLCFLLISLLYHNARKIWRKALIGIPMVLILLQTVSFISVLNDDTNKDMWGEGVFWQTADETLTINRINEVSSEKNTIIIVLDRLDQEFVEEIAAENPAFFDPLDGFTEFDDFITHFGSTFPSVSDLLTGHQYAYDIPINDFFYYSWEHAEMLRVLKSRGFDIRLYMDRGFAFNNVVQLDGLASNTFKGEIAINERIALVKLLKLSGYRYAPMPLKQLFWFAPTEFTDVLELTDDTAPYMVDDFAYYKRLSEQGLSVSDSKYLFTYIHLLGSHPPLHMDENIQFVEESTITAQTKGVFRIVYEYIDQLKRLGLYEDSLIIIMGDHGNYIGKDLPRPARTALFVKPAGCSDVPLRISHAPVSPNQLHATIMEAMTGDDGGFGDTFFDIKEGDDVVRLYSTTYWRYEIRGDGRDFSNWSFIGIFPDTYVFQK